MRGATKHFLFKLPLSYYSLTNSERKIFFFWKNITIAYIGWSNYSGLQKILQDFFDHVDIV